MASDNKQSAIHPGDSTEAADTPDRRDEGDRLAALYGLTPKVESAIVAAITAGAEDRARALVAPAVMAATIADSTFGVSP